MNLERLKAQITLHEGKRLKPYIDTVGKVTIGIGRNLTDRGITDEECQFLLEGDIKLVQIYAAAFSWYDDLDEVRQAVVLDMLFNMGPGRFAGFVKLISAIERRDWADAAFQMMDSTWAIQVGQRAIRLSEMMKTGKWP